MKMFEYLNQKQMNNVMILFCVIDTVEEIAEEWDKYGNLTKEERKAIRTANTWSKKFLNLLQQRLPDKEKGKLLKRYSDFSLKIMDKWLLSKFNEEIAEKGKIVRMERDVFEKFALEAAGAKCRDCSKSHTQCDFHDALYENLFPYAGEKQNCPYAFISKEAKEKAEQKKKDMLESKNKDSKRKSKKKLNRFDEDTEEYVYNFTPKGDR